MLIQRMEYLWPPVLNIVKKYIYEHFSEQVISKKEKCCPDSAICHHLHITVSTNVKKMKLKFSRKFG